MIARIKQEILDVIAFHYVGRKGRLGKWAINRVVNVWCRP